MVLSTGSPGAEHPPRAPRADLQSLQGLVRPRVELVNFRDVSQSCAALRLLLRPGVLYRSSNPWVANDAEAHALLSAGITHIVDLRTAMEQSEASVAEKRSSLLHHLRHLTVSKVSLINTRKKALRLFRAATWRQRAEMVLGMLGVLDEGAVHNVVSGLLLNAGLLGMYTEILEDSPSELRRCFEAMLRHDGPTLVHCTSGKDRTGIVVALLLSSAGIADEEIAEDYAVSEEFLSRLYDPRYTRTWTVGNNLGDEMKRAPADVMLALLRWVRHRFGNASAFLADHVGFCREDQARLHAKVLLGRDRLASSGPSSRDEGAGGRCCSSKL